MKARKKSKCVCCFVKNTQGATDISKWCLGEGIREDKALDVRQSNEILVKTAANTKENGGSKQLMNRINQELERPCMWDIWEKERNNISTVKNETKMCRHRKTNYGSYNYY
jgi:hypothetical protein